MFRLRPDGQRNTIACAPDESGFKRRYAWLFAGGDDIEDRKASANQRIQHRLAPQTLGELYHQLLDIRINSGTVVRSLVLTEGNIGRDGWPTYTKAKTELMSIHRSEARPRNTPKRARKSYF